jgi:hypothetical protein
METPSLFADSDPELARCQIELRWNNGPFTDGGWSFIVYLGPDHVVSLHSQTNQEQLDFAEVFHSLAVELNRVVIGHRLTNGHIRRGKAVLGVYPGSDLAPSARPWLGPITPGLGPV